MDNTECHFSILILNWFRSVEYFLDEDNPPGAAVSLDYQCFKDKVYRSFS